MLLNLLLISVLICGILVIVNRNSLYAIVSLIFSIVNMCMVLFYFNIEFLPLIILLIYIGAVAVLFLFIIMMLELYKEGLQQQFLFVLSIKYLLYYIIIFKSLFIIAFYNKKISIILNITSFEFVIYSHDISIFYNSLFKVSNDAVIFLNIFTQNYYYFLIIGCILLFSMVGSITLCIRQK
jgi:NADH-quinone oxidoreductase subunit J